MLKQRHARDAVQRLERPALAAGDVVACWPLRGRRTFRERCSREFVEPAAANPDVEIRDMVALQMLQHFEEMRDRRAAQPPLVRRQLAKFGERQIPPQADWPGFPGRSEMLRLTFIRAS